MGAIVRHCVGMSLARWSSFSSSSYRTAGRWLLVTAAERDRRTFDHSVFLIEGSNHSYQRALHCFGVFRTRSEDIRALGSESERDATLGLPGSDLPLVLAIFCNGCL